MTYLVTGGAGYIGAHVVRLLQRAGHECVVVDDLATGIPDRIPGVRIHQLDVSAEGAHEEIAGVLRNHDVTAVLHFAGRKQVGESVERPAWYYRQNIGGLANLLSAMESAGVGQLVFSSTASVYGEPDSGEIDELSPTVPMNPYGDSKLFGESLIDRFAQRGLVRAVSLRYFNVGGAMSPDLGDRAVLNLIPMVIERIEAGRPPVIFGGDYPTDDGTCVRDYIHVEDLAEAHLAVLPWLKDQSPGTHERFNVGTGVGASVREMVSLLLEVSGAPHEPELAPRRPGDPAIVVASPRRIADVIGWNATKGTREIVESAWRAHVERDG